MTTTSQEPRERNPASDADLPRGWTLLENGERIPAADRRWRLTDDGRLLQVHEPPGDPAEGEDNKT